MSNNLSITGTTRLWGCIAHPADHVRAPMLFNALFAETGADKVMVPIDIPPQHLAETIEGLRGMHNFVGAAVTIPHKMPLAALCDRLGAGAQATGAVNAVYFNEARELIGDNFDGEGFVAGLVGENPCGYEHPEAYFTDKQILIVGAGGAARAIAVSVARQNPAAINIANRTLSRAEDAAQMLASLVPGASSHGSDTASVDWSRYDMVINATSLGLHPDDSLPVALDSLSATCLVCDIIMRPKHTKLLQKAEQAGFTVHYGQHMLDYQMTLIGKFIKAHK